jgi:predicted AlkP superfamily phosphohydrolase/phosphomutase
MTKVLFIGLDSVDSNLLSQFEEFLPNLTRIKKASPQINLQSVFPPDSDTAWATICTGLNPAQHGIFDFVDPLDKSMKIQHVEKDNSNIKYKTFWDIAGKNGKKVCVLTPHLGYPVWEVNGIMIGRASIEDKIDTYPKDLVDKYPELELLIPWKGFPGNKELLKKFSESYRKLVLDETEIALKFLKEFECDLFYVYSSALDAIQHYFWNFHDEEDPSYKYDPEFKNTIRDFYILYDEMVGKLVSQVSSDTVIIISSDHGHGMRPVRLFNINEYLRQKGLLCVKSKKSNPLIFSIEKSKRFALEVVGKYHLQNHASKLLKVFPVGKKIYTVPMSIDWNKTCAYISDLSGIKSYSYGGIIIKKDNLGSLDYECVRSAIIDELLKITDPKDGKKIFKWICRREELYEGEYITKYPDIVFDMKYGYGAGWDTECPLFGTSKTHNFVPGSHRGDTPIFFVVNPELSTFSEEMCISEFNEIFSFVMKQFN